MAQQTGGRWHEAFSAWICESEVVVIAAIASSVLAMPLCVWCSRILTVPPWCMRLSFIAEGLGLLSHVLTEWLAGDWGSAAWSFSSFK